MLRRKKRYNPREYLIVAGLILVIIWLLFLIFGIAKKEEVARKAVRDTQTELKALEERRQTLEADLAALNTERGQEAALRETFGVAKPGEEVIIVVPPEEKPLPPPLPWWKALFRFMGF